MIYTWIGLLSGAMIMMFLTLDRMLLKRRIKVAELQTKAARWLAGYNFAHLAVLQDYVCHAYDTNYIDLERDLQDFQRESRVQPVLQLGQTFPVNQAPEELREAGLYYNHLPPLEVTSSLMRCGMLDRRCETVLTATLTHTLEHAEKVSRESGLDYGLVYRALVALQTTQQEEAAKMLGNRMAVTLG